jgi:bifunctional DNA-binding transcriptional regulator/antitoxin component of YhaV-PrlF toxin-antitoxin module
LIIPKALVDTLGITDKDTFEVRKTKAGISLSRIESTKEQMVLNDNYELICNPG